MKKSTKRKTPEEMQKIIHEIQGKIEKENMTVQAACEDADVHYSTYYNYLGKLKGAKRAIKKAAKNVAGKVRKKREEVAVNFSELNVKGGNRTLLIVTDDNATIASILESFR